ncbi:MAG: hypothetical protein AAGI66_03410 [Cyanobacteria bacterium P01_H01_bin.74]
MANKYIEILYHYRRFAFSIFAAVLFGAGLYTKLQDPVYSVHSEVFVNLERGMQSTDQSLLGNLRLQDRLINNQIELLYSDVLLNNTAKAAQQLLGEDFQIDKEDVTLADGIERIVKISKKDQTNVLSIQMTASLKPTELQVLMIQYLKAYKDRLEVLNTSNVLQEKTFLAQQLDEAEIQRENKAQAIQQFESTHQVYNIDTQVNQLLLLSSNLNKEITALSADIEASIKKVARTQKQLPATPQALNLISRLEDDATLSDLRKKITVLQTTISKKSAVLRPKHPEMKALFREKAALEKLFNARIKSLRSIQSGKGQLSEKQPEQPEQPEQPKQTALSEKENTGGMDTLFQSLPSVSRFDRTLADNAISDQINLDAKYAKIRHLKEQKKSIDEALKPFPEHALTYAMLQNDLKLLNEKVSNLKSRLDQASLAVEASKYFTQISVLKNPLLPKEPDYPKPVRNLLSAALIGLLFSLTAVYIRASASSRLNWPFQLSQILSHFSGKSVPVFEMAPLPTAHTRNQIIRHGSVIFPAAYQRVILHLDQCIRSHQYKNIGIMTLGALPGQYAPAILLSQYLANMEHSVVLIDADFETPYPASFLYDNQHAESTQGEYKTPGFSDYLYGSIPDSSSILQPLDGRDEVQFIPVGQASGNNGTHQSYFSHQKLNELQTHPEFSDRVLLFTLPRLGTSYSALPFCKKLDGIVLLAYPGHSALDDIKATAQEIEAVGGNVLAALYQPV